MRIIRRIGKKSSNCEIAGYDSMGIVDRMVILVSKPVFSQQDKFRSIVRNVLFRDSAGTVILIRCPAGVSQALIHSKTGMGAAAETVVMRRKRRAEER